MSNLEKQKGKPRKIWRVRFSSKILVGNRGDTTVQPGGREWSDWAVEIDYARRIVVLSRIDEKPALQVTEVPFENVIDWSYEPEIIEKPKPAAAPDTTPAAVA
jgi:hypothetical protein